MHYYNMKEFFTKTVLTARIVWHISIFGSHIIIRQILPADKCNNLMINTIVII